MSPRRDSPFDVNGAEDNMERYEDGWRVGYDVELNGTGFVEAGQSGNESESSFSDSEAESGFDAIESTQHSGYRSLFMESEEPSLRNMSASDNFDDDLLETIDSSESTELGEEETLNIAHDNNPIREKSSNTSGTVSDEVIPHQPNDIFLDDEKVEVIRAAMSSFTLPTPPQWPSLNNIELSNIIKEKITR